MVILKHLALIILLFTATVANCHGIGKGPDLEVKSLLKNPHLPIEKITQLQLYVEDIYSSQNSTIISVAKANSNLASPTLFGLVLVMDDAVRNKPNTSGEILGRAQGFLVYASLEEASLHMTLDLVFTSGRYSGSTLNIIGHNSYQTKNRELSIIGGTGVVRLARGWTMVNTVSTDRTTCHAFLEFNVTVLHYG